MSPLTSGFPASSAPRARRSGSTHRSSASRTSRGPAQARAWLLAVAEGLTEKIRGASVGGRHLFGEPSTQPSSAAGDGASSGTLQPTSDVLVGGADLRFYHREDCPMATGREWPAAALSGHTLAGRVPCGMCRP